MPQRFECELFADYFQFYLQDENASSDELSNLWTQEAVNRLLTVGPGRMGRHGSQHDSPRGHRSQRA
jgi:hypothetical protein